jgi:1,2-diacylglycerol 3-alpha-glucosyltransferase
MRVLMVSDVYFPRVNGVSTSIETFRRTLAGQGVEVRLVVPRYGDEADEPGIIRVAGRRCRATRKTGCSLAAMHRTVRAAARLRPDPRPDALRRPLRRPGGRPPPRAAGASSPITRCSRNTCSTTPLPAGRLAARPGPQLLAPPVQRRSTPSSCPRRPCADRLESLRRAPRRCTSCPPAFRWRALPAATARPSGPRTASCRSVRWPCLSAAWPMRRTSVSCSTPSPAPINAAPKPLLVVAGEGPAMESLRQQAAASAGRQRALHRLSRSRSALPDCYAAADVFVFASRTETQGLVLLEAMAAGTPVVALSAMGTAEILDGGRGRLSPADCPQAFGETLAHISESPGSLAAPWGRRGRLCARMVRCGHGGAHGGALSQHAEPGICP